MLAGCGHKCRVFWRSEKCKTVSFAQKELPLLGSKSTFGACSFHVRTLSKLTKPPTYTSVASVCVIVNVHACLIPAKYTCTLLHSCTAHARECCSHKDTLGSVHILCVHLWCGDFFFGSGLGFAIFLVLASVRPSACNSL